MPLKQFRVQPLGCSCNGKQAEACTLNYLSSIQTLDFGLWTLDLGLDLYRIDKIGE
jgi:hypothetical protein